MNYVKAIIGGIKIYNNLMVKLFFRPLEINNLPFWFKN